MVIDNSKVVIRDRMMMYIMAISLTVIIPLICLSDFFNNPVLGLSREIYVIIVCAVYVLFNLYRFFLNMNFFYFNDQSEKIVIKYYSLRPFMQKRRSIEILKGSLVKYQIIRSFVGRKKGLLLYQKIKNNTAKYPPISLSALNKEEYKNLVMALNSNIRSN
jgi:hypothetical protein